MSYDSYRPPPRPPSRFNASSEAAPGTNTIRSKDPRVRISSTPHQQIESTPSNIDGTGDVVDQAEISRIILEMTKAVFYREGSKRDRDQLQVQLSQENRNKESSLQQSAHPSYTEQLEERRLKVERKRNLAVNKFEESDRVMEDHVKKVTTLINAKLSEIASRGEKAVGELQNQFLQEKASHEQETVSLRSEMKEMKAEFQNQFIVLREAKVVEKSSSSKAEYDALARKVDRITDKAQEDMKTTAGIHQDLRQIKAEMVPFREQVAKQKLQIADLSNIFATKEAVQDVFKVADKLKAQILDFTSDASKTVDGLNKRVEDFTSGEYIKHVHLQAYIDKFNNHENKLFQMEKEVLANKNTQEQQSKALNETSLLAAQRLTTLEKDTAATFKTMKADFASVSAVKIGFDNVKKQILGIEHAIVGLNTRYNNWSSESLVKKITSVVDFRRNSVHEDVIKIQKQLKEHRAGYEQLKLFQAKTDQEHHDIQTSLSHMKTASTLTDNSVNSLKQGQTKINLKNAEISSQLTEALTASTSAITTSNEMSASQTKMSKEIIDIRESLSTISVTDSSMEEAVKKLQIDLDKVESQYTELSFKLSERLAKPRAPEQEAVELRRDLTALADAQSSIERKFKESTAAKSQTDKLIAESKDILASLSARLQDLESATRKSWDVQDATLVKIDADLTVAIEDVKSEGHKHRETLATELKSRQEKELTNFSIQVTGTKDAIEKRLTDLERAQELAVAVQRIPVDGPSVSNSFTKRRGSNDDTAHRTPQQGHGSDKDQLRVKASSIHSKTSFTHRQADPVSTSRSQSNDGKSLEPPADRHSNRTTPTHGHASKDLTTFKSGLAHSSANNKDDRGHHAAEVEDSDPDSDTIHYKPRYYQRGAKQAPITFDDDEEGDGVDDDSASELLRRWTKDNPAQATSKSNLGSPSVPSTSLKSGTNMIERLKPKSKRKHESLEGKSTPGKSKQKKSRNVR